MSIDVKFLGESFSFNDDLKIYIEALNDCEKISDDLFKAFRTKGNKNEGFIEVKDLHKDMLKHAEKFIAKLCEKGIFSKSAEDYTYNNKGYKAIDEACSDSVRARAQYLSEEIQAFKDGMNAAEYDAASKITGSGVSVYSSSFLTLAVASAVEQSIVNSQAQKANSEYSKAISELSDRTDSNLSRKNGQYYRNTYLPRMNEAITVFAYGLMEFFIADLMAEGKFDADVLENTDIKKSNTLLTNLKHISEEESRLNCIKQAFVACPFNTELYKAVLKSKKFDKDTFITAAIFGKSDVIINELREKINFNGVSSLSRDIEKSKKYMELYSVCTGVSYTETLHKYTVPFYEMVISDYQRLMKPNNIVAQKFDKMSEDSILNLNATSIKGHISNEVKGIISTDSFETLRTICGFTDILDKISVIDNTSHNFASKDELDDAYIEFLCKEYTKKIEAKQSELTDARNKKAEEERIRAEEEAARATKNEKIAKILLSIITIAIVLIIVFAYIILPNIKIGSAEKSIANGNFDNAIAIYTELGADNMVLDTKYKKAVSLMDAGDFDGSIAIFTELGEYSDCKDKITECERGIALQYIAEGKYNEGYKLLSDIGDIETRNMLIIERVEVLFENGEYPDALRLLDKFDLDNEEENYRYKYAEILFSNGDYKNAYNQISNSKVENAEEFAKDCQYMMAIKHLENEEYIACYNILSSLGDYKDCAVKLEEITEEVNNEKILEFKSKLKNLKRGDSFKFGEYEQDNNFSNGAEKIEWIVVDKYLGKVKVISKYGLEYLPYNLNGEKTNWENSSLCQWLNNDFIDSAFDEYSESIITNYSKDEPNKITLLSQSEIENDGFKQVNAIPTEYVESKGVYVYAGGHSKWWLRLNDESDIAPYAGAFSNYIKVSDSCIVRPVMCISTE